MDEQLHILIHRALMENTRLMLILAERIGIDPARRQSAEDLIDELEQWGKDNA